MSAELGASVRELARMTGLSREFLASAFKKHGVSIGRGTAARVDYEQALIAIVAELRAAGDPDRLPPIQRHAFWRSKVAELDYGVKSNKYVLRADVVQSNSTAYALIANTCRSIPDLLERRIGCSPEVAELAEQAIEDALDGLADAMLKKYEEAVAAETGEDTATV